MWDCNKYDEVRKSKKSIGQIFAIKLPIESNKSEKKHGPQRERTKERYTYAQERFQCNICSKKRMLFKGSMVGLDSYLAM